MEYSIKCKLIDFETSKFGNYRVWKLLDLELIGVKFYRNWKIIVLKTNGIISDKIIQSLKPMNPENLELGKSTDLEIIGFWN